MARRERTTSKLNFYHVIQRGISKADIFFDDRDRIRFLKYLAESVDVNFKIHCYCLMDNHYHLIVWANSPKVMSEKVRVIHIRYIRYINTTYKRDGTLFRGTYKSESINTWNYFENCVIYVLQNPIDKGDTDLKEYRWSSVRDYFVNKTGFVSTTLVEKFFKSRNELLASINRDDMIPYIGDGSEIRRKKVVERRDSERKQIYKFVRLHFNIVNPALLLFDKRLEMAIAIRNKMPDIPVMIISECINISINTIRKYSRNDL